jgi:membrane protein YdbS with pleckstrin-like domain
VLARSALVVAIAIVISWLEFSFGVAYNDAMTVLSTPPIIWTFLLIFLAWVLGIVRPLLIRASNLYILRSDGLEIRAGIITSKSFVVAPSGFSDLEVIRSISERIINSGHIVIRTQGDTNVKMERIRSPLKVAGQIREVMARPTVRVEG